MNTIKKLLLLVMVAFATNVMVAQRVIPMDSTIRYGQLDNGLTYYIKYNEAGGNYVNVSLFQNTGSLQEEADEYGVAHFIEHMAYNGSKQYPGRTAVDYLNRNYLVSGINYNAYTTLLSTQYDMYEIPAEDTTLLYGCMDILRGISCDLTFEDEMVEKEREIVLNEWKQEYTVESEDEYMKMLSKVYAPQERYGTHYTIGSEIVLKTANSKKLRRYYEKWYRPDMQAIAVVGAVNVDEVEKEIKRLWSDVPAPTTPIPHYDYEVNLHKGIIPVIIKNSGYAGSVSIIHKIPDISAEEKGSYRDIKRYVENNLTSKVLTSRMKNIVRRNREEMYDATAIFGSYFGSRWMDQYTVIGQVSSTKWEVAFENLVREMKQLRVYGVGQNEFQRAKNMLLQEIEYAEKVTDNKTNFAIIDLISVNFVEKETIDDEKEFAVVLKEMLDKYSVEDFNGHIAETFTDDNIVLLMEANDNWEIPTEKQFEKLYRKYYKEAEVKAFDEDIVDIRPATNLNLISENELTYIDTLGVDQIKFFLGNGAQVYLCKSDIAKENVDLVAYRKGGVALVDEKDIHNYFELGEVVARGGFGQNSREELAQYMESNFYGLSLSTNIGTVGFEGCASPSSLPALLTHVQLMFDKPVRDKEYFDNWKKSEVSYVEQNMGYPANDFADSLIVAQYGKSHPYMKYSLSGYDKKDVDYGRCCDVYEQLFSNIGDFTFIIVGDMDLEQMQNLAIEYLGAIPGEVTFAETPNPKNQSMLAPVTIEFENDKIKEGQSSVAVTIVVPMRHNVYDEIATEILQRILDEKLNEELREKMGVTYSATVSTGLTIENDELWLFVASEVRPGSEDKVKEVLYNQLQEIVDNGIDAEYFRTVKESISNEYYKNICLASYPMMSLYYTDRFGTDYIHEKYMNEYKVSADDIKHICRAFLNSKCEKLVIMKPAAK